MNWFVEMFTNKMFVIPITAWIFAQLMKCIIKMIQIRKFDMKRFVEDGGFPSGHATMTTCLAVTAGKLQGFDSVAFGICVIIAIIISHDACGIRREVSKQAKIINKITTSIKENLPKEIADKLLNELVGHSRLEVYSGVIIGIIYTLIVFWIIG